MTPAADPEMLARAEGAAAEIADGIYEYIGITPPGAMYDAIIALAVPAVLQMLQAQREDDQAKLIAKVAPTERGA